MRGLPVSVFFGFTLDKQLKNDRHLEPLMLVLSIIAARRLAREQRTGGGGMRIRPVL